jgi:hypothetical protein
MPMKKTPAAILKVQRLKDQGANGSPAYEFTTKIARVKEVRPMVCNFFNSVTHWCNPSKAPPLDPLNYGTPRRYFLGDTGCNPT